MEKEEQDLLPIKAKRGTQQCQVECDSIRSHCYVLSLIPGSYESTIGPLPPPSSSLSSVELPYIFDIASSRCAITFCRSNGVLSW